MMKTKAPAGVVALLLTLLLLLSSAPLCAGAEEAVTHKVTVLDNAGLFTEEETSALKKDMQSLSEYGNVFFYTSDESKEEFEIHSESKRAPFDSSDTIFFVILIEPLEEASKPEDAEDENETFTYYIYASRPLHDKLTGELMDPVFEKLNSTPSNSYGDFAHNAVVYTDRALRGEPLSVESVYQNPDTGFEARVLDDIDLLSESEEAKLLEDMKPLTEYGNTAFWSTQEYTSNEIEQARVKRKALYEFKSASVFVINMNPSVRKLTIQSYGKMYEVITDSRSRSITQNVSKHAANKKYYKCAEEAFSEMKTLLEGGQIPEPMKYFSYAVFSLLLGALIAIILAFSRLFNPMLQTNPEPARMRVNKRIAPKGVNFVKTGSTTVHRESSSSSGGGGCGGGGCGGGGGGCGGGGSSSF